MATELTEDGSKLKIGIRCKNGNSSYWSIFDNFRLYYYGSIPLDVVTGIEVQPISERKEVDATAIYDLSGRKVSSSATSVLPKGIYIQNGRKFVVK